MVGTSPTRLPRSRAAAAARRACAAEAISSTTQIAPSLAAPVGAIRIIQAGICDQQVVDDLAPKDRLGHDPTNVLDRHMAVPDSSGINHHGRSMLTLVQAARVVGPHERTQPCRP